MKSIKTKMIVYLGTVILIICVGLGIISYITSNNALVSNVNTTLPEIAIQTASSVEQKVTGDLLLLEGIASREDIANTTTSTEKN